MQSILKSTAYQTHEETLACIPIFLCAGDDCQRNGSARASFFQSVANPAGFAHARGAGGNKPVSWAKSVSNVHRTRARCYKYSSFGGQSLRRCHPGQPSHSARSPRHRRRPRPGNRGQSRNAGRTVLARCKPVAQFGSDPHCLRRAQPSARPKWNDFFALALRQFARKKWLLR